MYYFTDSECPHTCIPVVISNLLVMLQQAYRTTTTMDNASRGCVDRQRAGDYRR